MGVIVGQSYITPTLFLQLYSYITYSIFFLPQKSPGEIFRKTTRKMHAPL